jgi:hypothetical protein
VGEAVAEVWKVKYGMVTKNGGGCVVAAAVNGIHQIWTVYSR